MAILLLVQGFGLDPPHQDQGQGAAFLRVSVSSRWFCGIVFLRRYLIEILSDQNEASFDVPGSAFSPVASRLASSGGPVLLVPPESADSAI